MSEAELEEQVRDACKKLGVIRIHIYHARGTTAGVPDDVLIGPRGVLWRELKTMTGKGPRLSVRWERRSWRPGKTSLSGGRTTGSASESSGS